MGTEQKENIYKDLIAYLNSGKKAILVTEFGEAKSKKYLFTESVLAPANDLNAKSSMDLDKELMVKSLEVLESGRLQILKRSDGGIVLLEPYFPEPQLIIFGGGHISKPLVEFAAKVGFSVTVIDDRPLFANSSRFPLAERVICERFKKSFNLLNLNNSAFVVIVTRGHRHDMLCLKEALKYDTVYLGMIGSKRRVNILNEQLLREGYTYEQVQKINAPIGLEIDAVTPEEIAIAILAQVISYRRKRIRKSDKPKFKEGSPEFNRNVMDGLSKDKKEPKAIVTIISTKGSVPRQAGAKMIVFSDGRTVGSIGGGCSEGEVIHMARDIIKSRGYKVHTIDMTGYIAEEEGMVCGGLMEVIIEYNC